MWRCTPPPQPWRPEAMAKLPRVGWLAMKLQRAQWKLAKDMCFAYLNNRKKYRFWIAPKWCKEFLDPNRYLSKQRSMNQAIHFPLKNPYAPLSHHKMMATSSLPCWGTRPWPFAQEPLAGGESTQKQTSIFAGAEITWLDPWWFFWFYIHFRWCFFGEAEVLLVELLSGLWYVGLRWPGMNFSNDFAAKKRVHIYIYIYIYIYTYIYIYIYT